MNKKDYDFVRSKGILGIILTIIALVLLSLPYQYFDSPLIEMIFMFFLLIIVGYSYSLYKDYLIRIMKSEY